MRQRLTQSQVSSDTSRVARAPHVTRSVAIDRKASDL